MMSADVIETKLVTTNQRSLFACLKPQLERASGKLQAVVHLRADDRLLFLMRAL
jgi:hypothetical protein